jgi:hypothetical protein
MQQDHTSPSFSMPATQLYAGALAATGGSGLAFAGLFCLRLGLGDAPTQVASMLVLAILPVWLSAWAIPAFGRSARSAALAGMMSLFAGMSLPVFGLVAGRVIIVIAAATLLFCAWREHTALRRALLSAWPGMILLAGVTGGLVILLSAPLRLFMSEALLLGVAPSDNYWHMAIAQMIAHYHTVSIGGDGLVRQNYHFLFHFLVAGTAKAAGASVPLAYGYWSALTAKLQLIWSLYCAGILLFRTGDDGPAGAWWRLIYVWIAACFVAGFENESFILGTAYLAAYMPLIIVLLRGGPQADGSSMVALILACAGIFLVATAKVSAGYFGAIGLVLLTWTWRSNLRAALIVVTLVVLAAYTELLLIPKELVLSDSTFSILVMSYLTYLNRGILLHYLLPTLLIVVYLWRPRGQLTFDRSGALSASITGTPRLVMRGSLPNWIVQGRGAFRPLRWLLLADVNAQLIFLLLLGTLFVLFAIPIGDNVWDFSGILFGVSLLLLPMTVGETLNIHLTDRPIKWLLAITLTLQIFWAGALFVFNGNDSLQQALVSLYRAASGSATNQSSGAKEDIVLSLKTTRKPLTRLHDLIEQSPAARLERDLKRESASVNGDIAVHIPPAADDVWHYFLTAAPDKWCLYPHLWVPAVTGLVEIRSVPPQAIQKICAPPGITWYGYGRNQDLHRTADFTPEALCALARPLGARKVYRLMSYRDVSHNSVLICR